MRLAAPAVVGVLLLGALSDGVALAQKSQGTLTETQYRQALDRAEAALRSGEGIPEAIAPLREGLRLRSDSGRTYRAMPMLTAEEEQGLSSPPPHNEALIKSALKKVENAKQWTGWEGLWGAGQPASHEAVETIRNIAKSNEFKPGTFDQLVERVQNWLISFFDRFVSFSQTTSGAGFMVRVLVFLLVVFVCFTLLVLLRYVYSGSGKLPPPDDDSENPEERYTRPEDALAAAEKYMQAGDCLMALRLAFRAILLRLDRSGMIRLRPGLTNRGALRQVENPEIGSLLLPATDLFDDRFYRRQSADAGDYQQIRSCHDTIRDRLR